MISVNLVFGILLCSVGVGLLLFEVIDEFTKGRTVLLLQFSGFIVFVFGLILAVYFGWRSYSG